MTRSAESAAQAAKVAELKRLIKTGTFETLEKLEEAVDAFLWAEEEERESEDRSFDPSSWPHLVPK
jgi:hypothetical protein